MDDRDESCPRCGSRRLIRREIVLTDTGRPMWSAYLRLSPRLWWWLWRHRRRPGMVVRQTRHCEMCGYQWGREARRDDARCDEEAQA